MALTWGDIATAVIFNCGIAAICFIVFCFLRRMDMFYNFYNAKRRLAIPFRCALPLAPPEHYILAPSF